MGEAKRRQQAEGEKWGKEPPLLPWLPITQSQLIKVQQIANRGAWIGIIIVVIAWATIRFIGPIFGWWDVVY